MTKEKYQGIEINVEDPPYITEFSKTLLDGFYKRDDETISQALSRPAVAFCYGDYELAQRIYDYVYKGWFMYASPVLSNATKGMWVEAKGAYPNPDRGFANKWVFVSEEKEQGLPISCFAFDVPDTRDDQVEVMEEMATLCLVGGGTGAHLSIRAVGGKAQGPIPYMKVMDAIIGYFQQPFRKSAVAMYLDVDHPDIKEHIRFRKPGGDSKRRSDNRQQVHHGVNLTDKFIDAVFNDATIDLVCPHSKKVYETVRARELWEEILETRALTGEPFLLKIDAANRKMPDSQKAKGLKIKGSNLCSEITLPTDENRTFVCCLSSLNLEKYEEWKDTQIVEDLIRFLDNVLQYFIENAPPILWRAVNSAKMERALGLGTLGWQGFLQSKNIPMEGGGFNSAVQWAHKLHSMISERAEAESRRLAIERGEPEDMLDTGLRNSRRTAIAPNANSADLLDTSPSREPYYKNIFMKSSRAGNFKIKNRWLKKRLEELGKNTEEVWDSIEQNDGSVAHLDFLTEHDKKVFATFKEIDMHWLIEGAEAAGQHICQAQSLNVYMPYGAPRSYVNSVHLKFLQSPNVYTMYYYRTDKESKADNVKAIERIALIDWKGDAAECKSCEG